MPRLSLGLLLVCCACSSISPEPSEIASTGHCPQMSEWGSGGCAVVGGIVQSQSGIPVADVDVRIPETHGALLAFSKTDAGGHFQMQVVCVPGCPRQTDTLWLMAGQSWRDSM